MNYGVVVDGNIHDLIVDKNEAVVDEIVYKDEVVINENAYDRDNDNAHAINYGNIRESVINIDNLHLLQR